MQSSGSSVGLLLPEWNVPKSDTGAYCKARQRLPEGVLQRLVPEIAESLEQQVPLASAMVWATSAGV